MSDSVVTGPSAMADAIRIFQDCRSQGIFQRANAFRARFRTGAKRRIPVEMLGPHTHNRGGHYPQQERVRELAVQIILAGFTQAEADHEGVCVQMFPAEEAARRRALDHTFQTYTQFNLDRATGHLAACFDRSCGTGLRTGRCRTPTCASCCGQLP